ncbi:MAG: hypothetical protein JSS32_04225 [Verrucomicrobia bacterium]|nr:hypothetical protein [Verrucomicrobiota bacterium]
MKWIAPILLSLVLSTSLQADKITKDPDDYIRLKPVRPTPEPEAASIYIALPKNGADVSGNPVWVQTRVEGYALGADSYFDRAYEIANSDMGQTLHVVIDDHPYFAVNEPAIDPFREQGNYYIISYKFEVPFRLDPGLHTIRVFPARSFGEALKGENTFAVSTFTLKDGDDRLKANLSAPYLTYNEPSNQMHLVEGKPVLLDFYLSNCELSSDGYKIRLTIDGKTKRMITSWQPYYIYGLAKGKHTIRLELVDATDKLVPGPFNNVQRSITIHGS